MRLKVYHFILNHHTWMPSILPHTTNSPNKSSCTTESIILYESTPIIIYDIHILKSSERRTYKNLYVLPSPNHVYRLSLGKDPSVGHTSY